MIIHGYETYMDDIAASTFNAECVSRNIEPATVITYSDWLRQSINPLYFGKTEQYKVIKLQFRFEYDSDNDLFKYASGLTKAFEHCQLKFSNMDYYFDCAISGSSFVDKDGGKKELAITLNSSYAYIPEVTEILDHVASKTINVPGNLPTPAIVTVSIPIDTISITLTGFGDNPITIKYLKANIPVIIDGEACTVFQNGANKFSDTDMWEFPVLQSGSNTISVDNANCTIQIQYQPKWL